MVFGSYDVFQYKNKKQWYENSLQLIITYNKAQKEDTLSLEVGSTALNNRVKTVYYAAMNEDSTFRFDVPINYDFGYLNVKKLRKTYRNDNKFLLYNAFWEKGDSISFKVNETNHTPIPIVYKTFKGKGAKKYKVKEMLDSTLSEVRKKYKLSLSIKERNPLRIIYSRKVETDMLDFLSLYNDSITPLAYDVFKTKILMMPYESAMSFILSKRPERSSQSKQASQMASLFFPTTKLVKNERALANSIEYIQFYRNCFSRYNQMINARLSNDLFARSATDPESLLSIIIDNSKGDIRQALIINFLYDIGASEDYKDIYLKAKKYLVSEPYLSEYSNLLSQIKSNLHSYVFKDTNKKNVALSNFQGKVVLLDNWFSGCGGCVAYYKSVVEKVETHFKGDESFMVVSISKDTDYKKWRQAIKSGRYCHPEGVNLYTGGDGVNHRLFKDFNIIASPTPILMDSKGNMVSSFTNPELFNPEVLIHKIEKLLKVTKAN